MKFWRPYVVISGGNSNEDTSILGAGDGVVVCLAEGTTQAKVESGLSEGTLGFGIGDTPVDTLDHTSGRAGATSGEDLNGDNVGLLSNSVGGASEGSSGMGAMAVAIGVVVVNGVGTPADTSPELGVVDINTSVNAVDSDTLASGAVIDEVLVARGFVGDSAQSPGWSVWLSGESSQLDNTVMLNIVDLDQLLE